MTPRIIRDRHPKKEIKILDRSLIRKGILSTSFLINLGLLIVSAFLLYVVSDYPDMARTFPQLVLVIILVITVLDNVLLLRGKKKETTSEKANGGVGSRGQMKALYMVVLMFVYYFFLVIFSLVPATLLFLLLSGWTLGYKKPSRLIVSSVIITAFVYVIFRVIMKSLLPDAAILKIFGG